MSRGKRILIADDQPSVRELLRDMLEVEGFEVLESEDGPTTLAAVSGSQPDLIILDHMMPGITGLDVLRQLRGEGSGVPIIVLTAYADDETTWQGWAAGASFFMEKPFDPEDMLVWVNRLLSDPQPDQAPKYDLDSHHSLGDAERESPGDA